MRVLPPASLAGGPTAPHRALRRTEGEASNRSAPDRSSAACFRLAIVASSPGVTGSCCRQGSWSGNSSRQPVPPAPSLTPRSGKTGLGCGWLKLQGLEGTGPARYLSIAEFNVLPVTSAATAKVEATATAIKLLKRTAALRCQWPLVSAHGGQLKCPLVASGTAR